MSRYRKIDPRIWNDAKFRQLNDNGKLAFLFVLTHPHMTSLGAMRATIGGLASEIGWTVDAMSDAISHAISLGMVDANREASYMGLRSFLKYNEPEGPNSVIKAWPAALDLIPECPEKRDLAVRLKAYLIEKGEQFFGKINTDAMWDAIEDAIGDAMSDPSPIQEQEQEQEQESLPLASLAPKVPHDMLSTTDKPSSQNSESITGVDSEKTPRKTQLPADFALTDSMREYAIERLGETADVDATFEQFRDHHLKNGAKFASWEAAWRTWVMNGKKYGFPTITLEGVRNEVREARVRFISQHRQKGTDGDSQNRGLEPF